jgi:cation diffusion facilitator family transporter
MLLVATGLSLRPADEDHTYGHGKIEILGALIGGLTLLVLAGVILTLAMLRLSVEHTVQPSAVGFAAAVYTMIIDVFRVSILLSSLKTGSLSVKADLYHAFVDFVSTGLVLVALGLARLGYPIGDTVVSVIIAILLAYLSLRLIYLSCLDLSDAVSGNLVKSILEEIRRTDEVLKCKELRARRVGQMTYVDAVISISPFAQIVDADKIASKVEANLTKLLGKSSIMIHVEPMDSGIPVEVRVKNVTRSVEGARGIHNLSVTQVSGEFFITLHVQVDPSLALEKAHEIAEAVERNIEKAVPRIKQVTVHLEPFRAERASGTFVIDRSVSEAVKLIIQSHPEVKMSETIIYSTEAGIHVDSKCFFAADANISRVHDLISRIEEQIRRKLADAIVTIHPEPLRFQKISID